MALNLLVMLCMRAAEELEAEEVKKKEKLSKVMKKRKIKSGSHKNMKAVKPEPTLSLFSQHSMIPKIECVCRICGEDGDILIFDKSINRDIVIDIKTCASVEIEENDGLPRHICSACLRLLDGALLFKIKCELMDSELRLKLLELEQARIKEQEELEKQQQNYEVETFDDGGYSPFHIDENETCNNDFIWSKNYNAKKQIKFKYNSDPDENQRRGGFADCLKCNMCFIDKDEYLKHLPNCDLLRDKLLAEQAAKTSVPYPYLCEICGRGFKQNVTMRTHKMVHSDDLPFACSSCPYRGRSKDVLRIHLRVHTGERPYKCKKCPKTFINSSNMHKHKWVHETYRPFKCSKCDKEFASKRSVTDHEQSVHCGVKAYECDVCGLRFGSRKLLLRHRVRAHRDKVLRRGRLPVYLQLEEKEKAKQRRRMMAANPEYHDNWQLIPQT